MSSIFTDPQHFTLLYSITSLSMHCLIFNYIYIYISREGVAPSPTHWCSSYRKGSLRVTRDYGRQLYLLIYICVCVCVCVHAYIYIYIYIYICIYKYILVCVCVCVCVCVQSEDKKCLFAWVLWLINLCRLFNAKYIFYTNEQFCFKQFSLA